MAHKECAMLLVFVMSVAVAFPSNDRGTVLDNGSSEDTTVSTLESASSNTPNDGDDETTTNTETSDSATNDHGTTDAIDSPLIRDPDPEVGTETEEPVVGEEGTYPETTLKDPEQEIRQMEMTTEGENNIDIAEETDHGETDQKLEKDQNDLIQEPMAEDEKLPAEDVPSVGTETLGIPPEVPTTNAKDDEEEMATTTFPMTGEPNISEKQNEMEITSKTMSTLFSEEKDTSDQENRKALTDNGNVETATKTDETIAEKIIMKNDPEKQLGIEPVEIQVKKQQAPSVQSKPDNEKNDNPKKRLPVFTSNTKSGIVTPDSMFGEKQKETVSKKTSKNTENEEDHQIIIKFPTKADAKDLIAHPDVQRLISLNQEKAKGTEQIIDLQITKVQDKDEEIVYEIHEKGLLISAGECVHPKKYDRVQNGIWQFVFLVPIVGGFPIDGTATSDISGAPDHHKEFAVQQQEVPESINNQQIQQEPSGQASRKEEEDGGPQLESVSETEDPIENTSGRLVPSALPAHQLQTKEGAEIRLKTSKPKMERPAHLSNVKHNGEQSKYAGPKATLQEMLPMLEKALTLLEESLDLQLTEKSIEHNDQLKSTVSEEQEVTQSRVNSDPGDRQKSEDEQRFIKGAENEEFEDGGQRAIKKGERRAEAATTEFEENMEGNTNGGDHPEMEETQNEDVNMQSHIKQSNTSRNENVNRFIEFKMNDNMMTHADLPIFSVSMAHPGTPDTKTSGGNSELGEDSKTIVIRFPTSNLAVNDIINHSEYQGFIESHRNKGSTGILGIVLTELQTQDGNSEVQRGTSIASNLERNNRPTVPTKSEATGPDAGLVLLGFMIDMAPSARRGSKCHVTGSPRPLYGDLNKLNTSFSPVPPLLLPYWSRPYSV
ncbi:unnamed protein product [Cyprideis torosa]|uniref:Uncharacterized protein n=1 Tax=Cyprideis torosa TaxID=163714 RepID=A0A7R8WHA8_9CRUS|nr:unnamed protein product [Cyprideis torosa]CAG0892687.1 unnamed protein product [Cyprideis torosa]